MNSLGGFCGVTMINEYHLDFGNGECLRVTVLAVYVSANIFVNLDTLVNSVNGLGCFYIWVYNCIKAYSIVYFLRIQYHLSLSLNTYMRVCVFICLSFIDHFMLKWGVVWV